MFVFGVQSVIMVSCKPKASNKSNTPRNSPREAPFKWTKMCFSFLWVYRQIYNTFLTNQNARCLSYVMINVTPTGKGADKNF